MRFHAVTGIRPASLANLSNNKLIDLLTHVSALHSYMEKLVDEPIPDLCDYLLDVYREAERRGLHAADQLLDSLAAIQKKHLTLMLMGAMKQTIQAHGPIKSDDNIRSVAKRATGLIFQEINRAKKP